MAAIDLFRGLGQGDLVQLPVRVGVASDGMTCGRDLPGQLGLTLDVLADHEEGRLGLMLLEQAQHGHGLVAVGPVVERDRHAPASARTTPRNAEERVEPGPVDEGGPHQQGQATREEHGVQRPLGRLGRARQTPDGAGNQSQVEQGTRDAPKLPPELHVAMGRNLARFGGGATRVQVGPQNQPEGGG